MQDDTAKEIKIILAYFFILFFIFINLGIPTNVMHFLENQEPIIQEVVVVEKEIEYVEVETIIKVIETDGLYTEEEMFNSYLVYIELLMGMHEGNFDDWEFVWNSETNELDMFRWVNDTLIFDGTVTFEDFKEVVEE